MKKQLSLLFFTLCTALFLNAQTNDFPSSGNVGIGTLSPTEELEVYGNGASIKINASNASSLYSLKFTSNYDYGNKFTIQSGNAVVMQEKSILDVGGLGNTNSKLFLSNYYGVGFSSSSNPANENEIDLYIAGNANSVSKGNIGVGTTTPLTKFHVQSGNTNFNWSPITGTTAIFENTSANRSFVSIIGKSSGQSEIWFGDETSQNSGRLRYNHTVNSLSLWNGGDQKVTLLEDGNVGIGTTDTQGFKLGVNGKIAATEVKVATYANWPDYVFNGTYNLPALKDVEEHIKENGHLKDIPSAEKVKEGGFYLGDMDAKLLQKIEELTLYTIEQQKEIETLKKENTELKALSKRLEAIEALLNDQKQ